VAEHKVRLYDWNIRVIAEGVVEADEPPSFLNLSGALYHRRNNELEGFGYAVYRRECALLPIKITYHRGVPRG
jgi:hypothetical protein